MRYTVIVEETVSHEFPVEAQSAFEAEERVRKLYREGKVVLEPGNLEEVQFLVLSEDACGPAASV